jgi:predicted RNase H-like HicB family nuclease
VERLNMKQAAETGESIPVETRKETRHYFYSCPSLDLWSVGNTREEAERKLEEAIQILLSRCSKYGHPERTLRQADRKTAEMKPC